MSRYIVLYRDRGEGLATGGCVPIQSLYRDRRAVWLTDVSRYNRLYHDRRRLGNWLCRDTMLRHGQEGTTIRRKRRATRSDTGCDKAHNTVMTRPACKQCARPVREGWARVCTWCTQPSFDSVHSSESLFGILFMRTVHEVFKKNNIK